MLEKLPVYIKNSFIRAKDIIKVFQLYTLPYKNALDKLFQEITIAERESLFLKKEPNF